MKFQGLGIDVLFVGLLLIAGVLIFRRSYHLRSRIIDFFRGRQSVRYSLSDELEEKTCPAREYAPLSCATMRTSPVRNRAVSEEKLGR